MIFFFLFCLFFFFHFVRTSFCLPSAFVPPSFVDFLLYGAQTYTHTHMLGILFHFHCMFIHRDIYHMRVLWDERVSCYFVRWRWKWVWLAMYEWRGEWVSGDCRRKKTKIVKPKRLRNWTTTKKTTTDSYIMYIWYI